MSSQSSNNAKSRDFDWSNYLESDEQVIWQGRPVAGFNLDGLTLKLTLWVAVIVGWVVVDYAANKIAADLMEDGFFRFEEKFFGTYTPPEILTNFVIISCLLVIFYLLSCNLKFSFTHPRLCDYALTNKRALIVCRYPWRSFRSFGLSKQTGIAFLEQTAGSVMFDDDKPFYYRLKPFSCPSGFKNIEDAKTVYGLAIRVAKGNRCVT